LVAGPPQSIDLVLPLADFFLALDFGIGVPLLRAAQLALGFMLAVWARQIKRA
jgi:hypothetical protein